MFYCYHVSLAVHTCSQQYYVTVLHYTCLYRPLRFLFLFWRNFIKCWEGIKENFKNIKNPMEDLENSTKNLKIFFFNFGETLKKY